MATVTPAQNTDRETAIKASHRDEYTHLESLDHLGLVHDRKKNLSPVESLFAGKEGPVRPRGQHNVL